MIGLVAVAATGSAIAGTLSSYTQSQNRDQTVNTGTFTFTLTDPAGGAAGTPFTTSISGMAPGDFGDRLVNVANGGSINFASIGMAVTAPTTSLLDTDATNGLQLQVDMCSVAWTQASSSAAATCSGTTTAETALTAVSALKASGPSYTSGLASLTSAGTDYLRFHYSLPTASTGTAGLTSILHFVLTATQATGGAYH